MQPHEVLIKPVITEKSTLLGESGRYVFQVAPRANKRHIKEAVEKTFNVTVVAVNIARAPGKAKRIGPRMFTTPTVKKAVVTLKAGDKIQLVQGV